MLENPQAAEELEKPEQYSEDSPGQDRSETSGFHLAGEKSGENEYPGEKSEDEARFPGLIPQCAGFRFVCHHIIYA